ncbi:MAG: calcium-binding EGF-like domain-containing protein [Myxococcota bacterium]
MALAIAALTVGAAATGCKLGQEDPGELLVSKTIGVEGGVIEGGGLSLTFPAGALGGDTDIEIRASKVDLTAADFGMEGNARAILPDDLSLRLPAELTFGGGKAVLFQQDDLTVAALGPTAYINRLSIVAEANPGVPRITTLMPTLGATPADAGAALRDTAHFSMEVRDTPDMDVSMTIYDTAQVYDRPLNGSGIGECGFRLQQSLTGASLVGGCEGGFVTASLRVSSQFVDFDIEPFLSGKMDTPVTVGVVAGGPVIAYQLGFFSFDTSPCHNETCSGFGTCVDDGGEGSCECNAGYAPMGLECVCIPVCDGRECGGDSCGGGCGQCGDNEVCDEEPGQCVPAPDDPPDTGTGGMTDTGMATDDTMGMDESGGTTMGDATTSGTTGDPTTGGSSTTGMGSSGTG